MLCGFKQDRTPGQAGASARRPRGQVKPGNESGGEIRQAQASMGQNAQTGDRRETMKITIERGALLKSLNHVQSVVERRNTIPILSNVLIRSDRKSVL